MAVGTRLPGLTTENEQNRLPPELDASLALGFSLWRIFCSHLFLTCLCLVIKVSCAR